MNADERVPVTVVIEQSLLAKIDAVAKSLDLNRSQYLRRLAREALAANGHAIPTLPQAEKAEAA